MSFSADNAWERAKTLTPFPARLNAYYWDILSQYESAHSIATRARSKGIDPRDEVERKTVFDLADRVNQMLRLDQLDGHRLS